MRTTRLGDTPASLKISVKYCTARWPMRVADQQIELGPAHRLDAAGGVHVVGGDLRGEPACLARLGQRPGRAVDGRDLDRLGLSAQRQRKSGDGSAGDGGLEKRAALHESLLDLVRGNYKPRRGRTRSPRRRIVRRTRSCGSPGHWARTMTAVMPSRSW